MDLFEPGSGSKVHDFTGGIAPSGLVWTVPIPDEAIVVSQGGKRLDVNVQNAVVVDFQAPATVSFQMTWRGHGRAQARGRGTAVAPTDPAAFLGRFFRTRATGTFSGMAGGFTFESRSKPRSIYAELGTEQTGALLAGAVRCVACASGGGW